MVTTEDTAIIQKTRELCQTILDQPEFATLRKQIDGFMADEQAQAQYQAVLEKGEALQRKQQLGMPMTGEEVTDFEQQRDRLVKNPVAKGFLEARESIQSVQDSIVQHVAKTYELGRMPSPEDFDHGGCGHGCGCEH